LQMRKDFPHGKFKLKIQETTFSLKEYNAFLQAESSTITAFKTQQQNAFNAERERWIANGQANYSNEIEPVNAAETLEIAAGSRAVASHIAGNLWQIKAKVGDKVAAGDVLAIVESMKMEIAVIANTAGKVTQILCSEGVPVSAGQNLMVIAEE
jgi:urea carboxylase